MLSGLRIVKLLYSFVLCNVCSFLQSKAVLFFSFFFLFFFPLLFRSFSFVRFIIEYSSLRDFCPLVNLIIGLFLYEDFWNMIFWLVLLKDFGFF